MFARFTATFCLLLASVPRLAAGSLSGQATTIFLRARGGQAPGATIHEMKKELGVLMAAANVPVQWEDPSSHRVVNGSAIVVDFVGDCRVDFHSEMEPLMGRTPIASTAAADGYILPFVTVRCSALAAMLTPTITNLPDSMREFIFGRALARVLAHELYHILAQTDVHSESGLAKAGLSADDLIANRLEFDPAALDGVAEGK